MTGEEASKVVSSNPPLNLSSDNVLGDSRHSREPSGQSSTAADVSKVSVKDKNSNNVDEHPVGEIDGSALANERLNDSVKRNGSNDCESTLNNADESVLLLSEEEVKTVSKEQLCQAYLELKLLLQNYKRDNANIRESEEKLRLQQAESSRRENVLVMRLNNKEQELQEYIAQLNECKSAIAPTPNSLRSTLSDPAVNLVIQRMKKELQDTKKKLEDTQNDLNAWKFTPDSNTGKRLMAKCRMLYQENDDLGKMISSGRLAKLESDLALQRSLTDEMKKSQSELDDLIQELDEDVEGMQGTIYCLQQQLREHKHNSDTQNSCSQDGSSSNETVNVKLAELCEECRTLSQQNSTKVTEAQTSYEVASKSELERNCVNGENSENALSFCSTLNEKDVSWRTKGVFNAAERDVNSSDTNLVLSDHALQRTNVKCEDSSEVGVDNVEDFSDNDESPPPKKSKVVNCSSNSKQVEKLDPVKSEEAGICSQNGAVEMEH